MFVINYIVRGLSALLDKIYLLTDAAIAYCGYANEVLDYFSRVGYPSVGQENANPADLVLEIISPNVVVEPLHTSGRASFALGEITSSIAFENNA